MFFTESENVLTEFAELCQQYPNEAAVILWEKAGGSRQKGNRMLTCSFCNENDFDELGLEIHLANYCMGDQSPKLNSLAYREAAKQSGQADVEYCACNNNPPFHNDVCIACGLPRIPAAKILRG